MDKFSYVMLGSVSLTKWLFMLPAYMILSPLCMVSSRLFSFFLGFFDSHQSYGLLAVLSLELILSLCFMILLIRERAYRALFYSQFVWLLVISNCAVIGLTYSLFAREQACQQFLVKLATALFLLWSSEIISQRYSRCPEGDCLICYLPLDKQSMVLQCRHCFHEECLWRWVYQRRCCPSCSIAI